MGHTFWGWNRNEGCGAITFTGDLSRPWAVKRGLVTAFNCILSIAAAGLAIHSFILVHSMAQSLYYNNLSALTAKICAFLVVFVTTADVLFTLCKLFNTEEEHFTLSVQGHWTKVTQGSWVRVRPEDVNASMLLNDRYQQSRSRIGGGGIFGHMIAAGRMVAAGSSGVILSTLQYVTKVLRNSEGPRVFAGRDDTKKWLEQPSVADIESAACCDTDESGCFIFCRNCNFKYKSFSAQANLTLIGFVQFCCTVSFLSDLNPDLSWNPFLVTTGSEVLLLILAAFVSFLNSTDFKCCVFCINVDRHFRHSGAYIALLNDLVTTAFHKENSITEQPAVTNADNVVTGHPKYTREYLRVKAGCEQEQRVLQELLSQHHDQLYAKAFPSSPSAPLTLTGAQIKLLDDFYSLKENRSLVTVTDPS